MKVKAITIKGDNARKLAIVDYIQPFYQTTGSEMDQTDIMEEMVAAHKLYKSNREYVAEFESLDRKYCKAGETIQDCLKRLQDDSDRLQVLQSVECNEKPLDLTKHDLLASKPQFTIDEIQKVIASEPTNADDQSDFEVARKFIVIYNYCKAKDDTITAEEVITLCIDAFYEEIIEFKKEVAA